MSPRYTLGPVALGPLAKATLTDAFQCFLLCSGEHHEVAHHAFLLLTEWIASSCRVWKGSALLAGPYVLFPPNTTFEILHILRLQVLVVHRSQEKNFLIVARGKNSRP